MTPDDAHPSPNVMHTVDVSENTRKVALAITSASLGLGRGNPLWLVITANKESGELVCALRATLPTPFQPQ